MHCTVCIMLVLCTVFLGCRTSVFRVRTHYYSSLVLACVYTRFRVNTHTDDCGSVFVYGVFGLCSSTVYGASGCVQWNDRSFFDDMDEQNEATCGIRTELGAESAQTWSQVSGLFISYMSLLGCALLCKVGILYLHSGDRAELIPVRLTLQWTCLCAIVAGSLCAVLMLALPWTTDVTTCTAYEYCGAVCDSNDCQGRVGVGWICLCAAFGVSLICELLLLNPQILHIRWFRRPMNLPPNIELYPPANAPAPPDLFQAQRYQIHARSTARSPVRLARTGSPTLDLPPLQTSRPWRHEGVELSHCSAHLVDLTLSSPPTPSSPLTTTGQTALLGTTR
jgi:hypothetical protein